MPNRDVRQTLRQGPDSLCKAGTTGAITENDAIREGYTSVEEYLEAFLRIYEKKLIGMRLVDIGRMPVWVIDFEVVGS